jgi:hypothetical protein
VTIEHPGEKNAGNLPMAAQTAYTADVNSGDDRSADAATADSCVIQPPLSGTESEVNSATGKQGDAHSAKQTPDKNGSRIQSDAGSALKNSAGKSDGSKTAKVPSMCPPKNLRRKLMPFPAPPTKQFLKQKKISLPPPPPYQESDPPRQNLIAEVFTTQATIESVELFTKKTWPH